MNRFDLYANVGRAPLLCLTDHDDDEGEKPDDSGTHTAGEALVCAVCQTLISDHAALIALDGASPYRTFSNPHGLIFEVMTLISAHNTQLAGAATTEFTWFPGYAWEICHCAKCGSHLGWRFTGVEGDASPSTFYGFVRQAVIDALAH